MAGYPPRNVIYTERIANAAAAVQSSSIDVSSAEEMIIKSEFSTNTDTAVIGLLFKDKNGVGTYTVTKTISNSGKQLGVTNAGWFQGDAIRVNVKNVDSVVIDLQSISGGNIYIYTGERYDNT